MDKVVESSHRFITGQAFKSIFYYISRFGVDSFITAINNRCEQIYSTESAACSYTEISLRNNLARMLDEEHLNIHQLPGIEIKSGKYFLKTRADLYTTLKDKLYFSDEQYIAFKSAIHHRDYNRMLDILSVCEQSKEKLIYLLFELLFY